MSNNLTAAKAELEKRYAECLKVLARCRHAMNREAWQDGPTDNEVLAEIEELLIEKAQDDEIARMRVVDSEVPEHVYRRAAQRLAEYFAGARQPDSVGRTLPVTAEEIERIITENTVTDTAWRGAFEWIANELGVTPDMTHCSAAAFSVAKAIRKLKAELPEFMEPQAVS